MAEERTFVEKIQDCLKGVDGMVPYMFPMIGKNYENAKRKILVVCGYIFQDKFVKEKFKPVADKIAQKPHPLLTDENSIDYYRLEKIFWGSPDSFKDDIIRYAWEKMPIDGNPNGIRTPQSVLKGECNVDDIIFTSYSRFPSNAKFRHGENDLQVQLPNCPYAGIVFGKELAKNFLIDLIECAKPDEVWVLGQYTENLVFEIPKYPGKLNVEKYKKEKRQELEFPNYRLISLRAVNIAKSVSDKLEKKFDKFVQGKEFAKLSNEQKKENLIRFADHIQEAIKQLK